MASSIDTRTASWIAAAVTAVWAVSMLADVAMSTYEPPAAGHAALMAVLGVIFDMRRRDNP